jgi:hypothetical protein
MRCQGIGSVIAELRIVFSDGLFNMVMKLRIPLNEKNLLSS